MRILRKPKVYLIARPQVAEGLEEFLNENDLEWPTSTEGVTDASRVVEIAGRCCYMSFGKKAGSKTNQAYVNNLLGRDSEGNFREGPAHGSVIEHPVWTFIIVGAGRGFSHEQVRHRVGWAYSQLSTRYCDFEREEQEGTWEPGFVIPPLAQLHPDTELRFRQKLEESQKAYVELLSMIENDLKNNQGFMAQLAEMPKRDQKRTLRKAARGATRDILPIATEAIMTMSANARALWNTVYLRANDQAEAPIRQIYVQIAKIMEKEFPELFQGLTYYKAWDGEECVSLPKDKL